MPTRVGSLVRYTSSLARGAVPRRWSPPVRSTADLLEVFAERRVGAWNWGLVDGRSQTRFPWTSWIRPQSDDGKWFHDLFHVGGRPSDPDEVALFQRIASAER